MDSTKDPVEAASDLAVRQQKAAPLPKFGGRSSPDISRHILSETLDQGPRVEEAAVQDLLLRAAEDDDQLAEETNALESDSERAQAVQAVPEQQEARPIQDDDDAGELERDVPPPQEDTEGEGSDNNGREEHTSGASQSPPAQTEVFGADSESSQRKRRRKSRVDVDRDRRSTSPGNSKPSAPAAVNGDSAANTAAIGQPEPGSPTPATSLSPRRIARTPSSARSTSAHKKRMTVLLDGEMPDDLDDDEEGEDEDDLDGEEEGASEGTAGEESEDDLVSDEDRNEDRTTAARPKEVVPSSISIRPDSAALEPHAVATKNSTSRHTSVASSSKALSGDESASASEDVAMDASSASASNSEEDDDSDEEEVEPSLKYQRLKGGVADIFTKDSASAFAVSDRFLALGTHNGMIFILDVEGNIVKGFRSHSASILDIAIDSTSEFVASAGMDGLISISALSTSEQYAFDFKRPMRCVALEPHFGRRNTRAFICGGMSGSLIHREKSWFGHKETVLHSDEGPIWTIKWRGNVVAWANDKGVRLMDVPSRQRITFVSPPSADVRADMFRCSLLWANDSTLIIGWADHIKIARLKDRRVASSGSAVPVPGLGSSSSLPLVEITAIFELDCIISGIVPYGKDFLVLAYITEDADDSIPLASRRRRAQPPELRIISHGGEEMSSDILSLHDFDRYRCNDYILVPAAESLTDSPSGVPPDPDANLLYIISPKDITIARPRDDRDHVNWLLERRRYEEALVKVEAMGSTKAQSYGFDSASIGRRYLDWLIEDGNYALAAKVASKILGRNVQAWEDWIFLFVERGHISTIIPFVPTSDPTLNGLVYDMILAHFIQHDPDALLRTVKQWPPEIYSTQAVVLAIEDRMKTDSRPLLMECLAELFLANRQPGKALPYFLRLRRPGVFDLIREHNLFTAVQDQALLLIEFQEDLATDEEKRATRVSVARKSRASMLVPSRHGAAIDLLVDHTHSILVHRVIEQLEGHDRFQYMYLDALFDRDPLLASTFADLQVKLYAEFDYERLMPYLRAMSSAYSFEKAYLVCKEHDYVPEMVFLLGRVGDNKRALNLIIERLGDVERAIDFAKEQNDDDLWDDLLRYSESRPAFIRGLLENVGAEIDPIRLIRRIKDGLVIEGLKPALMKILQDFSLQISLLEGCAAILFQDVRVISSTLHRAQTGAQYGDLQSICDKCSELLFLPPPLGAVPLSTLPAVHIFFLCQHRFHLTCLVPPENVPQANKARAVTASSVTGTSKPATTINAAKAQAERALEELGLPRVLMTVTQAGPRGDGMYGPAARATELERASSRQIAYEARLRVVLRAGCPICRAEAQGKLDDRVPV